MATKTFAHSQYPLPDSDTEHRPLGVNVTDKFYYDNLANGDDGSIIKLNSEPLSISAFAEGNFSGSATIHLEGSWDGTVWVQMNDSFGAPVALGSDEAVFLEGAPPWLRPNVNGGDGSTDIDLTIAVRCYDQTS